MYTENVEIERNTENNEENNASVEEQNPAIAIDNDEIAVATNSSQIEFIDMNTDCIEEVLEYFTIDELLVFRRISKKFKSVIDNFIETYYPSKQIGYGCIVLTKHKFETFHKLDTYTLSLIKQITLWTGELNEISKIQPEFWKQIERFQIGTWEFHGDFYETILKYCENLKDLSICHIMNDTVIGKNNKWLHRQYKSIEHISLDDSDVGGPGPVGWEIPELKIFFQKNPNIRSFSTSFNFLWENRHCWLDTNIKIDVLKVQGDCFLQSGMDRICKLLNQLFEQGFFKRIHMKATYIYNQEDMNAILSLKGMEKIYLACVEIKTTLPSLPYLRELGICYDGNFDDFETIAKNLLRVDCVYFSHARSDTLIPFIKYAALVQKIKIDHLDEGTFFENGIINLVELNEIRKTLTYACPIKIYVSEKIFLATKWALNTEMDFVRLKRIE